MTGRGETPRGNEALVAESLEFRPERFGIESERKTRRDVCDSIRSQVTVMEKDVDSVELHQP